MLRKPEWNNTDSLKVYEIGRSAIESLIAERNFHIRLYHAAIYSVIAAWGFIVW